MYKNNREAIRVAKMGITTPWGDDDDIVIVLKEIFHQYTKEQCREILEVAKKEMAAQKKR